MANILDYLFWRGDLTFVERPFNEVDNLILCELAYANWGDRVPLLGSGKILLLSEAARIYREAGIDQSKQMNNPAPLLRAAATARRFSGAGMGSYVNHVDKETEVQFSATTFYLEDGSVFVAFRGTDSTLVGWREDFNFSYQAETPAQREAVAYLEYIASITVGPLHVGGHSKGGNLALYAAASVSEAARERIQGIWCNDGPGLNEKASEAEGYEAIQDRVRLIIPEESMVGILMNGGRERKVVRSTAKGFGQHSPYSWEVRRDCFEEAGGQAASSVLVDQTVQRWMETLNDEEKKNVIRSVFDAMEASGADTLGEFRERGTAALVGALRRVMDSGPEVQKNFRDAFRKLYEAGTDTVLGGARKGLEDLLARGWEKASALPDRLSALKGPNAEEENNDGKNDGEDPKKT